MSEEWQKPPCQSHNFDSIRHKVSNMVIIWKWVIIKGLNTEQKYSRATTLYNENVDNKEASKSDFTEYEWKRD